MDTLVEAFDAAWLDPSRRDTVALTDGEHSLHYPLLHTRVAALAASLRAAGVQSGDRVAIAMARSLDQVLAILATMVAGACPCPLEPKLGAEELTRRYRLARLDWTLVAAAGADEVAAGILPAARLLHGEALAGQAASGFPVLTIDPLADAFLLFTSGSSGKPKGVLQNHRGLLTNARGIVAHTGLTAADCLLHVMPLYHTNGVNNQILAPLLAGATVVLAPRFRAEEMPALFARHRPTLFTGVPTIYARMLAFDFAPDSLARLRMLRCGSAPITETLHQQIEARFGRPLVVSYGLSEATCTSTMNPPAARRIGTVGTVLPGQRVFLAAADGTPVTDPGREGEVCIAGPALMTGYLDEGSAGKPRPVGDVLRTGDLGCFDADGYLSITGRLKDVIIRGGENLSPNLIEEALMTVPGVAACCVVGQPDADLGEVPVAVIVRQTDTAGASVTAAALDAAVLQALSRIHRPAAYRFAPALPENAVGKVDRKRLARELDQWAPGDGPPETGR